MRLDVDAVTRIIERTAAEEVMPRFRALADHEVREKAPGDLVTVADEAAERRLSHELCALHPGTLVLGEEAAAADPGALELVRGAEPLWIVDPIDGTGNFAAGRPIFAVMVALVHGGRTLAAWINQPIAGRTAVAEVGAGAWIGGRRLRVAPTAAPAEMRGSLHADTFATKAVARQVARRRERVGAIKSLRCAGVEYLRMAAGETHFSLFTKLMPWDHAPGVLIHGEAGGTARTLDGVAYGPARRDAPALILAPDEAGWQALHAALFGDDEDRGTEGG